MISLAKMEDLYQRIVFGYNEPHVCFMHPLTITDFLDELGKQGHHQFMIFNSAKVKPKMSLGPGEVEFVYEAGPYKDCSSKGFVNS